MADLPTRVDLFAIGRDFVLTKATKIDPAQVDIAGSDVNIFCGVASVLAYQIILQLAFRTGALLLDGADDEDLDRYAFDRYGLTRKGASPALGSVRIFRTALTFGAGTVPVGTKVSTLTGAEYITTSSASFGATDLESSANVRASQAGKATQAGAEAIRRFPQAGLLFDNTLQVINDDATAGGEDAEDDDTFRARIRDFWRSARRGILAAIESGARSVPGVVSAQAIEALTAGNTPARVVSLYIADSTGIASDALAEQVRVALDDFRAGGIAVLVSKSLPQIAEITLRLAFRANVDTPTLTDNIRAAMVDFVNSVPVNGTLYLGQLYTVLQRFEADGLIPTQASIVSPTGDLVPGTGQTIRTTVANVVVLP